MHGQSHSLDVDLAWDNCINQRYSDSLQEDVNKLPKWNKVDHFGLFGSHHPQPQTYNCRFPVIVD